MERTLVSGAQLSRHQPAFVFTVCLFVYRRVFAPAAQTCRVVRKAQGEDGHVEKLSRGQRLSRACKDLRGEGHMIDGGSELALTCSE